MIVAQQAMPKQFVKSFKINGYTHTRFKDLFRIKADKDHTKKLFYIEAKVRKILF